MDTNVILARFAPRDPLHAVARNFLSPPRGQKVVSPISFLEMQAVLSRGTVGLDIPDFLVGERGPRKIKALAEYFIKLLDLRMESIALTVRLRISGTGVNMPLEYSEALRKAAELKLKTLDLLHLSYAGLISNMRVRIENFVTSDGDILDRESIIREQFGFKVIHPKDAPS